MTNVILKLRDLLNDNLSVVPDDIQSYLGGAKVFTLNYMSIDSTTLVVLKNGVTWASSNYTYSATTGKVTVSGTLSTGDVLTFQYSAYLKYSDTELRGYIRSSVYHLSVEKYKVFTIKTDNVIFPTPSEAEESLIAIVAALIIKGNVKSYRTPEFTINFDTDNMSIEKKIRQTLKQFKKTYGSITYIDLTKDGAATDEE